MNLGTAGWVLLICSLAIPVITAKLTAHPSELTGLLTQILSGVGGVLANLSQNGWDHITWKAAEMAFLAWGVALGTHFGVTRQRELKLHKTGPQLGKDSPGLPLAA